MAKAGRNVKAYIGVTGTGSSVTYTWLTGEQSNSFNLTQAQLEVTDKSSAWQQFIAGIKGATAEITVFADNTNAQQKAAIKSIHDGATIKVFIGELGTGQQASTPTDGDAFDALVTSIGDTNEVGGIATRQISVVASGAVTHYPALT
ncbi:MAG: hypothetical protein J6T09_06095 [Bacteroidales bacterium]|nr:hypothetical protein [Bacteroidales bacterium]